MSDKILSGILESQEEQDTFEFLTRGLSGTAFNSLMLEVFRQRSLTLRPADVLRAYQGNRFVQQADIDPISFKKQELKLMEYLSEKGYEFVEFGPVAPFGTCSAMGYINQNLVLSAGRGVEVVSDVTNLLALETAKRKKLVPSKTTMSLAASHRLTRCQLAETAGHTAHFKIICLTDSGRDTGNSDFEVQSLSRQINMYIDTFNQVYQLAPEALQVKVFYLLQNNRSKLDSIFGRLQSLCPDVQIEKIELPSEKKIYYRDLQFQINVLQGDQEYFIVDGGFVDWTQQMLQNKKERLLTSGMGIEYLYKVLR